MKNKRIVTVLLFTLICASIFAAPLDYFGTKYKNEQIKTAADFLKYYELFVKDVEAKSAAGKTVSYSDFSKISTANTEFALFITSDPVGKKIVFSMMETLAYSNLSTRLAVAISEIDVADPTTADLMSAYGDALNAYGYGYSLGF